MLLAQMWGSLRFGLSSPSFYSVIFAHPAALLGYPDGQTDSLMCVPGMSYCRPGLWPHCFEGSGNRAGIDPIS